MPILETILFKSENGRLKLTATDLEISIVQDIDADIEVDGAVAIPARRLLETLRQLPNITVFFDVDERKNINFKTDRGNYKLVGDEAEEYPDVPNLDDGVSISTTTDLIHKAINKTLFADQVTIFVRQ